MTEEQRKRYLMLKEKNRQYVYEKEFENNILFQECKDALKQCKVLSSEETKQVFNIFEKNYPISVFGRIEWEKFKVFYRVESEDDLHESKENKRYYILWDLAGLPVIICDLYTILENIDDVLSVSFDTWLLSEDGKEVIEFYHEAEITYGRIIDYRGYEVV